jgi:hypothetical protein
MVADAVTAPRDAIPAMIADGSDATTGHRPDPVYELGRHLALMLRDGCEEAGRGCDPHSEPPGNDGFDGVMVVWLARVQSFLRGIGPLAERRRLYQTILFLGIEPTLCQSLLAVDHLDGFFDHAAHLIGRMQSDYPILFDRVEGWVIWQAAAWWQQARLGIYHIARPDGTIFVKGEHNPPDVLPRPMRLDELPGVDLREGPFYAGLAPSWLTERLADGGPGENPPIGHDRPWHVRGGAEAGTPAISLAAPTTI